MNWLLKITEGPMKGAEIALVPGSRVTFGKGEHCDIVIADASLADEAFALDVTESAVTLVLDEGSTCPMNPFETRTFGTTEVVVGPSEGAWEPLRPAPQPTEAPSEEPAAEPSAEDKPSTADEAAAVPESRRRHSLWPLLILLLLAVLLAAAWYGRAWYLPQRDPKPVTVARPAAVMESVKLRELAAANGLKFVSSNGLVRISGNLKRRTERLAVRALALSASPYCSLDLSDDESFRSAAEALLFTVTEGAVKVAVATNRVLAVTGYAPDAAALVRVLEALAKDMPWLTAAGTDDVRVGGALPPDLSGNRFAQTGQLSNRSAESVVPAVVVETTVAPAETNGTNVVSETLATLTPEDLQARALVRMAQRTAGKLPRGLLPVAGILTRPYPCVVLHGGQRLVEGAKVQGLEIRGIESGRVTFGFRTDNVYWEP